MGSLRSGLEEYRLADVGACSTAEIESDLSELRAAIGGLQAECARRIAELERRRSFERDGHLSMASWVESRFGVGWSEAAREVRMARGLEYMPAARGALASGEVSSSAVGRLVEARESDPGAFARAENTLVEAARTLPARLFRRSVALWKEQVDATSARVAEAERYDRRGLDVSPTADGMVRLDGSLDPETGGTVMTAVRSVTAGWARCGDDARSPAQRRADALGEICRGFLDGSWSSDAGMERPHITVVVDLETLEGRAGSSVGSREVGARRSHASVSVGRRSDASVSVGRRRSESSEVTSLPAEAVRRLACDASVSRVIVRGSSEPLDVGRTTRVVPPALRRALAVRDGGCAFPTCDRPVGWCDAHHVRHWADGGRTELSNLVLLCRRHHTLTHSGFGVEVVDGRVVARRPDGSEIARRAGHGDPPVVEATPSGLDRAPP